MTTDARPNGRFGRQVELFGQAGQDVIARATVAVLGLGGLGSHVCQQLAYLGVRSYIVVDHDLAEETNLNRLIGANQDDVGKAKVAIAERIIEWIQPGAEVQPISHALPHPEIEAALEGVDLIMGCFDNDYPRMLTTDLASGLKIPYIDAATGINVESMIYGGRVVAAGSSPGCLHCYNELDPHEIRRATMSEEELAIEAKIYGIPVEQLRGTGPSVVSLNGVVASVAVTEAMALVTGLRGPHKFQRYVANEGVMRISGDAPREDCYYCTRWIA